MKSIHRLPRKDLLKFFIYAIFSTVIAIFASCLLMSTRTKFFFLKFFCLNTRSMLNIVKYISHIIVKIHYKKYHLLLYVCVIHM